MFMFSFVLLAQVAPPALSSSTHGLYQEANDWLSLALFCLSLI